MLIQDKHAIVEVQEIKYEILLVPRIEKNVNQVWQKCNTGRELRMNAQIGDYDMDYIFLDLGSDFNILTR